jgi:hypothetical protein
VTPVAEFAGACKATEMLLETPGSATLIAAMDMLPVGMVDGAA